MRRTLTLCRTGLAGAAALALLTACGGGSSDDSASSSSSSPTTSAGSSSSSAPAADTEFCQQAATLEQDLAGINTSDPAQIAPAFQQLADKLHQLDPPAELKSDWTSFVGAVDQIAQAAQTTDFNDQQQANAFLQKLSQLQTQLGSSATNVENYLSNECGLAPTESSAPTS